ncbi:uncharacterized protein DS421_11g347550 [Arachis hypogaea]|nr:uncharacterized protein DS421_11g347550 [Arachis hypogaea]
MSSAVTTTKAVKVDGDGLSSNNDGLSSETTGAVTATRAVRFSTEKSRRRRLWVKMTGSLRNGEWAETVNH